MHFPSYHLKFSNVLKGERHWHTSKNRKTGSDVTIYPVSLHKLEYFMIHFSSTLVVCMQSKHQDCKQHSYTVCFQDCDQNFFQALLGILVGKSPGHCY